MKPFKESEIASILCFITALLFVMFCPNPYIYGTLFCISLLLFINILYQNKIHTIQLKSIICHYKGILSANEIHWCAWNEHFEFIGSSNGFLKFFPSILNQYEQCNETNDYDNIDLQIKNQNIKNINEIKIIDILDSLTQVEKKLFAQHIEELFKNGLAFEMIVCPLCSESKIKIIASKVYINNIATISIWCHDITQFAVNLTKATESWKSTKSKADELEAILNLLPIPIWCRTSNLQMHFCNETYMKYVDAFKDKVIKDNIPLVKGNLFGQGTSLAENAQKTKRKQKIQHYTVVNGVRKKIEMYEHPADVETEGLVVGYAFDISEKEELENKVDSMITGNNEILESLSTAVAIFGDNMRLKFFNSSYKKMTGLDESWLYSAPLFSEVLEHLRDLRQIPELTSFLDYKKTQLELFTTLIEPRQELMFLPNGKTVRCYISTYYLGGLLFLYEDVTSTMDLERQHNTLLAVQKETIDHLYEGIAVFGSNNKLKLSNASLFNVWKLENINIETINNELHLTTFVDAILCTLEIKENPETLKVDLIDKMTDRNPKSIKLFTRDEKIILFSYMPLPDGSHLHSFMDVTDSAKVEEALLERNQALEISNNLRVEFIANIYSEMMKPINVINGFIDLLKDPFYGVLSDKHSQHCECIQTVLNDMSSSLRNIVDMSSIESETLKLDISSFDIQDSILEMIKLGNEKAGLKQITIHTHLNTKIKEFQGDQQRIMQAFYNILMNFINLSEAKGQIYVSTEIVKEQSQKSLKISISNYNLFSDKRISDKTNINSSNVLLLGLPFARSIVEMHHGKFIVKKNNELLLIYCILPIPKKKTFVNCMSEDDFNKLSLVS